MNPFDFWINMGFNIIITVLQSVIKNPVSKAQMKRAFRKVFDLILIAYPEFLEGRNS